MLEIYQASKTSCFLIGNGFIFFNAAKQILHLHNGLLYLQTNRVQLFLLKHKNSEVYIVKCKIKLEALEIIVLRYDHV